ncbi:hypothetical protein PRK78_005776 [Emydomyces testavorans]|uniref:Uncharacterized protein n=1 Tax=Emydomyces testavorans TaxID=2070801 RepID=A0AAF0DMV0_9EURO|nr:hypothetical protein PRK78_005776 [Emydomyces testavorans]
MSSAPAPSFSLPRVSITPTRDVLGTGQSVEIDVTVHNDNEDTPLTILSWNNPLDTMAAILGVFELRDKETDELVEMDRIQVSRMLPPPPEHLVEIPPKGSEKAHAVLKGASLSRGHTYSVCAKGWWQSIWNLPKDEVIEKYLADQSGAVSGDFLSNTVDVKQG